MRYGYVRVSTKEQNIDRQMSALAFENIPQNQIFIDRASGKDFDRTEYQKLLTVLQADDEIVIKSIDRLGRNYDDILEQWQLLTKTKKVHISVLDFPLLNTKNTSDTITGKLISDLVLQVLSYVSQMEREQIKQRQLEGIREAQKRGKQFGRPKINIPENFYELAEKHSQKEITIREGAEILGVSKSTFHNWIKNYSFCQKSRKFWTTSISPFLIQNNEKFSILMDYIFFVYSINFVHKSLHYWTKDYFKNNRRSLLMKTKSKIKLFATAIIATASIGVAGAITQSNTVIANEVTVTERDGFPTVTFETDAVFKNFEEANAYAEGRASEILEATDGYKDYSLNAGPALDGTSNYLVSGEIRAYKDYSGSSVTAEQAKKNIEAAARKVVKDANPSLSTTKPVTPTKPSEEVKPETPAKPVEEVKPETPTKPAEDVKPETPTKPAEEVKPGTPAKPVEEVKPETPTKPVEEVKPETPAKPVEDVKPETPAKPENNKNNNKKTLPNTGESTSILGIIGSVLSITGLGFIVKRKRG